MAFIKEPENLDFTNEKISMIITGLPGKGKTTLALSAPNAVIIDADKGLSRVRPEHRKPTISFTNYEEILADIEEVRKGGYETIIIDTGGALIESMKDWAMRNNESARQRDGSITIKGFGIVKTEFLRLSAYLRKYFNVIFIFHEIREKGSGDKDVFYDIVCEGSAKNLVWASASFGGHLFVENGKRYLGVTPTEQYNAKSALGVRGLIEIPELEEGQPNNFLTVLFEKIKQNMAAQSKEFAESRKKYNAAMEKGNEILATLQKPENAIKTLEKVRKLEHSLTSLKELEAIFKGVVKENNWVYDPKTKTYITAETKGEEIK